MSELPGEATASGVAATSGEVWVLGATGRSGRAVARRLERAGIAPVLVGRDGERLRQVSADLAREPRTLAGSLEALLADALPRERPAVVINTVGPFATTGAQVARACPPGTHYVDIANEMQAVQAMLDLDGAAASTDRVLVTGAGFGVLATESVALRVCAGQPPPARLRVDALASVASEPGVLGEALAHSIVDGIPGGGWAVRDGRLRRAAVFGEPMQLTTPDGYRLTTAGVPSGELIAAWRASHADAVLAASSAAPDGTAVRLAMPLVSAVFRLPGVVNLVASRLARVRTHARERPMPYSWARARAEWPGGRVSEGWLRIGDAMDFTAAVAAEVALRLHRGEGRPGAHTPGSLFGPALATAAGGEFLLDQT